MEATTNKQGRVLGKFVTRKSGHSVILTVPAETGIKPGQEYTLRVQDDGSLLYEPRHVNFWHTPDAEKHNFRADLDKIGNFSEEPRIGKEI